MDDKINQAVSFLIEEWVNTQNFIPYWITDEMLIQLDRSIYQRLYSELGWSQSD